MSPEMDVAMRGASRRTSAEPEPVVASPDPSLVEQAEGLNRATAMKDVVGPSFDALLRPIYSTGLEEHEKHGLQQLPLEKFHHLERFSEAVNAILMRRSDDLTAGSEDFKPLSELNKNRVDLFFNSDHLHIVREAIDSGVIIPLTVAAHIHLVEKDEDDFFLFRGGSAPITAQSLADIMERNNFDEILLHLTKGPNGFLGQKSNELSATNTKFFHFVYAGSAVAMDIRDAYEVRDGKVVGLSNKYHLAASQKRKIVRENHEHESRFIGGSPHKGADSSGCPVRHSFPDPETGEPQEPLVITAKKFLVEALRANQQQPQQEAA